MRSAMIRALTRLPILMRRSRRVRKALKPFSALSSSVTSLEHVARHHRHDLGVLIIHAEPHADRLVGFIPPERTQDHLGDGDLPSFLGDWVGSSQRAHAT